jgi:hypothetical protein
MRWRYGGGGVRVWLGYGGRKETTDHLTPPVSEVERRKARGWAARLLDSAAGPLRRWASRPSDPTAQGRGGRPSGLPGRFGTPGKSISLFFSFVSFLF